MTTGQLAEEALSFSKELRVGKQLLNVSIDEILAAAVRYLLH